MCLKIWYMPLKPAIDIHLTTAPPKLIVVRTYICGIFPFAKPPIGLILHTCICIHIFITNNKNRFELWIHDMSNRWSPKH